MYPVGTVYPIIKDIFYFLLHVVLYMHLDCVGFAAQLKAITKNSFKFIKN